MLAVELLPAVELLLPNALLVRGNLTIIHPLNLAHNKAHNKPLSGLKTRSFVCLLARLKRSQWKKELWSLTRKFSRRRIRPRKKT
jgi:hypothetical protein